MNRDDGDDYVVVETPERSALERFAAWFHQDWKLIFQDFDEGAEMYVRSLSDLELSALQEQLGDFLRDCRHLREKELQKEWLALGSQAWPRDRQLADLLSGFLRLIEEEGTRRR